MKIKDVDFNGMYYYNPRFRAYVDKYCRTYHKKPEEAITYKVVQEYAISIMPGGVNCKDDKPRTM